LSYNLYKFRDNLPALFRLTTIFTSSADRCGDASICNWTIRVSLKSDTRSGCPPPTGLRCSHPSANGGAVLLGLVHRPLEVLHAMLEKPVAVARRVALLATCFCVIACLGCDQQEAIRRYQVPKTSDEVADDRAARPLGAMPPDAAPHSQARGRMLGAIVPRGDRAWFFKAVGPVEEMAEYTDGFRSLIESIRFEDDQPEWDLPDGWRQQPASGMRIATVQFGPEEDPIEMSVIPLAVPDGDTDACIVMNVNRWRDQMGLPQLTAVQVQEQTEQIALAEETAVLVDLNASDAARVSTGSEAGSGATRMTEIRLQAPAGWSEGEKVVSRGGITLRHEAAFEATQGDDRIDITVDRMPAGGSLLENAVRWQAQIGLEPGNPAELAQGIEKLTVGGLAAEFIELVGREQTILGVVIAGEGESWYIKLKGDNELAIREQERFREFLQSIRFE
jgi:hypothetical protein